MNALTQARKLGAHLARREPPLSYRTDAFNRALKAIEDGMPTSGVITLIEAGQSRLDSNQREWLKERLASRDDSSANLARRDPPLVALGPDSIDRVTPFAPFPAMEREALALDACRKLVLALKDGEAAARSGNWHKVMDAHRAALAALGMVGND